MNLYLMQIISKLMSCSAMASDIERCSMVIGQVFIICTEQLSEKKNKYKVLDKVKTVYHNYDSIQYNVDTRPV